MSDVLGELVRDVHACATLESLATGKGLPKPPKPRARRRAAAPRGAAQPKAVPFDTHERVADVVQACREERKRQLAGAPEEDLSDARLSKLARFTDGAALAPYAPFLHFVPRLVNIVTLAEAVPMPGSGLTPGQPLDLAKIAAKCNGAYFAPKRFAAVQLAYTNPRCRILVFRKPMHTSNPYTLDTGRIVGTGCQGAMGARLAIARAQRQLSDEAGVHLHIREFAVGAVSLRATLSCEAFADAHRAESHFDRSSFVGLAWRPPGESCCVEIYSTGRANIPGSRTERALHKSFSRMLPELLRFSSSARLLVQIPEELQAVHRSFGSVAFGVPDVVVVPPPTAAEAEAEPVEELDDSVLASLGL